MSFEDQLACERSDQMSMKQKRAALLALPAVVAVAVLAGLSARALATGGNNLGSVHDLHDGTFAGAQPPGPLVAAVRNATERFRDARNAQAEAYAPQFSCVSGPDFGAMGIHFINFPLVADGTLDVQHPESVIYEPTSDGRLRLVGTEFVVLKAQWDAAHPGPPQLMGQLFHLTTEPNRYGLPAFYSLHVWAWRGNPLGSFVNWHPGVSCEAFKGDPPDPGGDGDHH
jgi:hypothetical protein